jgi:uncharacterized protein
MKILSILAFIFSLISGTAFANDYKLMGRVNDYTGTLSHSQIVELETKLKTFETSRSDKPQFVAVIINSLEGDSIENFSTDLFNKWKLGQKELDNGILMVISIKDRKVRLETGYGIESQIPAIVVNKVIQDIKPELKKSDWSGAIAKASDLMKGFLENPDTIPQDNSSSLSIILWVIGFIIAYILLSLVLFLIFGIDIFTPIIFAITSGSSSGGSSGFSGRGGSSGGGGSSGSW